jgi:hypothetical protein
VSCKKAQEVLAKKKYDVKNNVDARKEKIDSETAWDMFKKNETVVIGSGKKFSVYKPVEKNRAMILKSAIGRSGSLRAPSLIVGQTLVVGFNEDMYETYIKG